jgi:predicted TIM-barrel fold metal-dependent hydrolase
MNRRDFLAAAAVLPAISFAAQDTPTMIPVIDTHQHLWDLSKVKLAWLQPGTELDANFTPKEYAQATANLNIVKAVYMEVDVIPEHKQIEADYVIALCESGNSPTCAAVVGGDPSGDGFTKYVKQFKGHKYVKGIRQVLHAESTPPGYCLKPEFVKGVQLLGELGLSFDLCVRPAELPDFAKLIDQCPDTRFILDHCGNPRASFTKEQWDTWQRNMNEIARRNHIVCKVSGFLANGWEKGKWTPEDIAPAINGTIEAFGWDRVMFGGDWPVVLAAGTYKDWLTGLQAVVKNCPEADQRKLFHDNAAKFYGI